jgi:23S rRNA (uracil1939-C5)-methyltransferase
LGSEITEKLLNFLNENVKNKKSLYQLRLREGHYTGDFMVELITSDPNLPYQDKLKEFIRHIPEIKSFYHTIAFDQKNYGWERRLLAGSPIIYEKIGKYSFQISPESFFQTNSEGVKILYDKIKEFADIKIGDRILDLYCGTGTISIYLSTLAKKVTGIEIVQNAINDANANAKINRTVNTEFVCADATKWLKNNFEEIKKSQNLKIILDPPREGLNKDLIQSLYELSNFMNFQLIYISCNPSTFARDIKIFEENGMKLEKVQPIDMFPQTHHIECVGNISRAREDIIEHKNI